MASAAWMFPEQALCARHHWAVPTREPVFRAMECEYGCVSMLQGPESGQLGTRGGLLPLLALEDLSLSACPFREGGPVLKQVQQEQLQMSL